MLTNTPIFKTDPHFCGTVLYLNAFLIVILLLLEANIITQIWQSKKSVDLNESKIYFTPNYPKSFVIEVLGLVKHNFGI